MTKRAQQHPDEALLNTVGGMPKGLQLELGDSNYNPAVMPGNYGLINAQHPAHPTGALKQYNENNDLDQDNIPGRVIPGFIPDQGPVVDRY